MLKPTGRRSRHVGVVSAVVLVVAGAALAGGSPAAVGAETDGTTSRVSVSSTGTQSDGVSTERPAFSTDGRFVAFINYGSTLVTGDTNNAPDVFVRDRTAGTTTRVSVSSDEGQSGGPNALIFSVAISADGRYVAFSSGMEGLVPGDTNEETDVFVRDRTTGTTRRVSVSSSQRQGNGEALSVSISADGRYVAYASRASNLVSGDTNGLADVFVRDRSAATTRRVSVSSNQRQANGSSFDPALSEDGTHVAFRSTASNLVSGDTNGGEDVFIRYRPTSATRRISVSSNETQTPRGTEPTRPVPAISAGGRYVAFHSTASNLASGDTNGDGTDVFVRDRVAGTTQRVSMSNDEAQGNSGGADPSISSDGQRVAFNSGASGLVPGDTNGWADVFVRDRVAGTTSRVSVSSDGAQGNNRSDLSAISGDGGHVAFTSPASNLVPGDTNGQQDTFVRDFAP